MLCLGELPELFLAYYDSPQQNCPKFLSTSRAVSTEISNSWHIDTVAHLGANCKYTVSIESRNEAGKTNSTGKLFISKKLFMIKSTVAFQLVIIQVCSIILDTTVILAKVQHWN